MNCGMPIMDWSVVRREERLRFAGLQDGFLATARAGKSIATGPAVALQSSTTEHWHSECKRSHASP